MSKEREPKRRSPSVIARLMGFEGLPSQQPAHKQRKKSHHILQETSYEDRSMRKSSKEQQQFKDVYEVLETTKAESRRYSSQCTETSEISGANLAFVHQKFMDVKRLSTDEKLQSSKEFTDALEVLDSNTELFLKFLQEPDSLFSKHLHDLRRDPCQSQCNHVATRRTSGAPRCGSQDVVSKSNPCTNYSSPTLKNRDSFCIRSYSTGAHDDLKSSRFLSGGKAEASILPTRIVVLKPNLGRAQNVAKSVSSPHPPYASLPDCNIQKNMANVKSRKVERCGKRNLCDEEELSRHKSGESREIARRITRRMRGSVSTGSLDFSPYGFRGYAGDESSCYASGNESANETDITLMSRKSFDWSSRHKPSSSHSSGSSVSKEAKKRLSERWKMTQKFQEVGLGRSSTLGEMLAISDRDLRGENLDTIIDKACNRNSRFASNDGWIRPLGISSKDGWKDGCIRKLPRSRSLPASSEAFDSPRISMRHKTLEDERYLMPKKTVKKRSKGLKGEVSQEEGSTNRCLKSSSKNSRTRSLSRENCEALLEVHVCQNQVQTRHDDDGPCEQKSVISDIPVCSAMADNMLDEVVNPQHENLATFSAFPDKLLPGSSASMSNRSSPSDDFSMTISQEMSNGPSEEDSIPLSHPAVDPESPASSKEAEQPSPLSVLEIPFKDDLSSSSECFGSLSADLQGLRMQLQLLKLESGGSEQGPIDISSDEDVEEDSLGVSKDKELWIAEEGLDLSYAIDVLSHSGFSDADPDLFVATWHSTECPVDPLVFEKLENKYGEQTVTWSRSERKLLFDQVNAGLGEIFHQFTNPHPWVKPWGHCMKPKRSKNDFENDLFKWLTSHLNQGKMSNEEMEKVLTKESWLDLGDEIDEIGKEVVKMLMDEVVAELVLVS